jgi:hypothetical protein
MRVTRYCRRRRALIQINANRPCARPEMTSTTPDRWSKTQPTFFDIRAGAVCTRAQPRKDKGVAILDYALGNRPSTGGEVGGRLCPQRARRQLVPVVAAIRSSFRPLGRTSQLAARPQPATKKAPAGRAASGHATAAPPSIVMNSRRLMCCLLRLEATHYHTATRKRCRASQQN